MKLTQRTFQVLKNFSTVNPTLSVSKGNVIRTVSQNKTVLAQAMVQEEFPRDFAIYDLSEFLGVISLFNEPDFDFDTYYVSISDDNKASSQYFYADKSMVTVPPDKGVELPDTPIKFVLGDKVLKHLLQAASVMSLPELCIQGDGDVIKVIANNTKNTTAHQFSYEVGKTSEQFKAVFKVENLKLIAGAYDVTISTQRLAQFTLTDGSLTYWIAMEGSSFFGGQ
jgi:hypothetical protein|tara:strand:- start:537 stop:1208 length:672 start_codon:yes stop_codon:yes gene_type:complete